MISYELSFSVPLQRREIAFLKSQLEAVKGEKEEVSQRLNAVKRAAKQGLESTSKR